MPNILDSGSGHGRCGDSTVYNVGEKVMSNDYAIDIWIKNLTTV